jgi:hypothetical protein
MATARILQWFGDETDPAANAPATASTGTEASGAAAPSNGSQLRRRFRGFDPTTDETLHLWFKLPANYVSGGTLVFNYSTNATTGNVIWKTAWCLLVSGTTDFDGAAFGTVTAQSANATPGTAGVTKEVSLDLAVTGAAPGDLLAVMLGRDADNGSDTVNGSDAELCEPWMLTFTVT